MPISLTKPRHFFTLDDVTIACGATHSRYINRDDLVIFRFPSHSTMAACFTTNAFAAAPVFVAKQNLQQQPVAWVINAGNANAATGNQGIRNAQKICAYVAKTLGCRCDQVMPFSTGVIGEQLPLHNTKNNAFAQTITLLGNDVKKVQQSQLWYNAAKAIMTTDTIPKGVSVRIPWHNTHFTINGIAKGSGMICPQMATMLAFIVTDVCISNELLQEMLTDNVQKTFNCISVDGDTSTNDSVAIAAVGKHSHKNVDISAQLQQTFQHALHSVCDSLAQSIIRDGEGITKLLCIEVENAQDQYEANAVARAIAHSPLVKTALFAGDPNWGRIACAIGNARIHNIDTQKISLFLGKYCVMRNGCLYEHYTQEQGAKVFANNEVHLRILLERGSASTRFFTSDFSHQYIDINASYRS